MTNSYAIFCADPLDGRSVEPDFRAEAAAASDAGFNVVTLDHDALDHRTDALRALKKTRFTGPGLAVYRGWMLRSEAYKVLYDELLSRGVRMVVEPAAYDACHHAPGSYAALSDFMPRTTWVEANRLDDTSAVGDALTRYGTSAVVIKDWVKSQAAGYWTEACFIPNASRLDQAAGIIARFRELQGDSLVGGVVLKAYIPLVPVGAPADEYRAFVVGHRVVGCWPRSSGARELSGPPDQMLAEIASRLPSPFASADFGIDGQGKWWLLEVGDGQVSGLPDMEAAKPLFRALSNLLNSTPTG